MQQKELTEKIIGCAYSVYNQMGFGFLESVYEKCLLTELKKTGLQPVPVLQLEFPNPWRILANPPKNLNWSGRRDSNSGPLEPHSSALPDCATPRKRPKLFRQ